MSRARRGRTALLLPLLLAGAMLVGPRPGAAPQVEAQTAPSGIFTSTVSPATSLASPGRAIEQRENPNPSNLNAVPTRIVIPSTGVDAPIDPFDLDADFAMPVPQLASLVGWYSFGAQAGGDGNAIVAGHRDWARQKGVFYDLPLVLPGDDVWLEDASGDFFQYRVVRAFSVPDTETDIASLLGYTLRPSLTLITCAGDFDRSVGSYVERRIVRAELINVIPAAGTPLT